MQYTTLVYSVYTVMTEYSKCPKISYIKVSHKMAYINSAYPDKTAPEQAILCLPFLYVL